MKYLKNISVALSLALLTVACSEDPSKQTTEAPKTVEAKSSSQDQTESSSKAETPSVAEAPSQPEAENKSIELSSNSTSHSTEEKVDFEDVFAGNFSHYKINKPQWIVSKVKTSANGSYFRLTHHLINHKVEGSELGEFDKSGKQLWSYSPKVKGEMIQDFDITASGLPVVINSVDGKHLHVLSWASKNGIPNLVRVLADTQQRVATYWNPIHQWSIPITKISPNNFFLLRKEYARDQNQARIVVGPDLIFVSAIGYVGEKIFALDLEGYVKWQALVFPSTTLRRESAKAPTILVKNDKIYAYTPVAKKEKHLLKDDGISLGFDSDVASLIQSWTLDGKRSSSAHFEDLNIVAMSATESGIIVYNETAKGSQFATEVFIEDDSLENEKSRSFELKLNTDEKFKLNSLTTLSNGDLLLAGLCGVQYGDNEQVIRAGKGCILQINTQGQLLTRKDLEYPAGYEPSLAGMDVSSDGEVFLGGYFTHGEEFFGFRGMLDSFSTGSGAFVPVISSTTISNTTNSPNTSNTPAGPAKAPGKWGWLKSWWSK